MWLSGSMNFLLGGQTIEVRRKPVQDSWGETTAGKVFEIHGIGVAPRTTESVNGDGFRSRAQAGYTLYVDDEQALLLEDGDEFVLILGGRRTIWTNDGMIFGGNWQNPLSTFSGGQEINLKYIKTEGRAPEVGP